MAVGGHIKKDHSMGSVMISREWATVKLENVRF